MARGFESKFVEEQRQVSLTRPVENDSRLPDPALSFRRRRLELARIDCLHRLAMARAEGHREILRRAIEALDREIGGLPER